MGFAYAHGQGVPANVVQAIAWYRKSAEHGNVGGQFNLGVIYEHGEGVPKDSIQALKWYRMAAEPLDGGAENNLGTMYFEGNGVVHHRIYNLHGPALTGFFAEHYPSIGRLVLAS